jgi:CTP:phosphocholine cytidylyltransferase-like protein
MNIIILGDKYQKRMKSRGCVGLIKLQNKNILHHQYKILTNKFALSKIVYIYGFDNKRLLSYLEKNNQAYSQLEFVHNNRYDQYNNAYSLSLVKEYLDDDLLIMFGDKILTANTFSKFDSSKFSQIFIDHNSQSKLGCIIHNNKVENICYDLDNNLSEIYFISRDQAQDLKKIVSNPSFYNYFVFELLNKMIDSNQTIVPHFINKKTSNAI